MTVDPHRDERLAILDEATQLRDEARAIRRSLDQVALWNVVRRRRIVLLLVLAIVLAVHAHEVGRIVCGHGDPDQPSATAVVVACDVAWPEAATDAADTWPTWANLLGVSLYAAAFVAGWRAYAAPSAARRRTLDDR